MNQTDAILLDVAAAHINRPRDGRLETVAKERTGLSATRAWQRINALLDDSEANAAYPMLMGTLRARRDRARRVVA